MRYVGLTISAATTLLLSAFFCPPIAKAQTTAIPAAQPHADDKTIYCNHAALKNAPPVDVVRCLDATTANNILLFSRGPQVEIDLPIQNDNANPIHADYVASLIDRQNRTLNESSGSIDLVAGSATGVKYELTTAPLNYGVLSLMLHISSDGKPLTDREYYLGITDDAKIPKSPDGAFLYGLDPNYGGIIFKAPIPPSPPQHAHWTQGQCDLLPWIDAMGVDIVRCAGCQLEINHTLHPERLNWINDDLPKILSQGLRVMGMASPPAPDSKAPDGFLPETVEKWTKLVEESARKTPQITYWELGNEPDLGYPGIDRYVQIYEQTYKAVKRGNPNALVMNGAITFHAANGLKNSPRLIETIKPDSIDILAYHAHGFGSSAERGIYSQVRDAMVKYGKAKLPVVDTESGMFVGSKKQEDMQAWMVVEKQTYAQAIGLKFLMTFRLHAFRSERGWGLLRSDNEPQPAILSYRTMTETLKGLAFQHPLEMKQEYAEGCYFTEKSGNRRACVLWSNQPAFYNVYLKVAGVAAQAVHAQTMDVYGNAAPAVVSEDGVAHVQVTEAPIYLTWAASDPQFDVSVAKSMLKLPDMATIVPDGTSNLPINIENPSTVPLTATLSASINAPGQATITPPTQSLTIPPGQSVPANLAIQWNSQQQSVAWPESWTVYTDLHDGDVDPSTLHEIPSNIKNSTGRRMRMIQHIMNLLGPNEAPREKQTAYVFGIIRSDKDQVVRIGCTADYWMQMTLNGKVVCDTLKDGDGSATLAERVVELPLQRGDNLLAIKVLSGKGGWNVAIASPDELPSLLDPTKADNCVDLKLTADGKTLADERLSLNPVRRIAPITDITFDDSLDRWNTVEPDATLGSEHVTNLFEKQPDRSKWWQGNQDLSATAWIRCDDKRIYLIVSVLDDRDVTGKDPATIRWFDCMRVGVSRDGKSNDEYSIGRLIDKPAIFKEISSQGLPKGLVTNSPEISADVTRGDKETLYRISLDRSLVGDGLFRLNFMVNDNDDGARKQTLEYSEGMASSNPLPWHQFILTSKGK